MTRRFATLAWAAAICTYLLIVLGAVVRITGSGLGCGEHWPLCNGHLFPPLNDIGTVIEWSHRLVATLVTILVVGLAIPGLALGVRESKARYVALGLLAVQILLGAITVKLALPAWTVVLHLGTAMLLLATLLIIATSSLAPLSSPPSPLSAGRRGGTLVIVPLAFVTVLLGALTANLGAASACGGFPLCNGQVWTTAGPLAVIHWTHRLLAYALAIVAVIWAARSRRTSAALVVVMIAVQIIVGATMVLNGLPRVLQATHVAVGAAVWASVVLAARAAVLPQNNEAPVTTSPEPRTDSREKPVSSTS